MPISAHFIFRNFWDFSRKRQKSAIFVAKNPLCGQKFFIKMATKFNVFTLKICRLAKNPLFSLTYLKK
jgi:hypothetical protein